MSHILSKLRYIGVPIIIGVGGLLWMALIAYLLRSETLPLWRISPYKIVNLTFTMQLMVLPVSFIALGLMYLYDRAVFKKFFRAGFREDNWNFYGPVVAISFTAGTALMMSFGVTSQNGTTNSTFVSLIPLVVFFSATNAWSEEIFSRFVIVAGLNGKLSAGTICLVSAIIFGLPHFFGTPSGVSGVIMAGILGGILAKSVIDTKGLGWALGIHFLQDLVIFGAGALIIAGQ
jgi:membrane protease YdiL (CAAX protease family)